MYKRQVTDCEKGIKRLTTHNDTQLVIISDWSKEGSGFTLYEVTCSHPEAWNTESDDGIKILCCPDQWRLIMAGGRFNTSTEAGYAPVEGELLGIASALHKTRYFISGHPKVTIVTDHKPILNFLQDRSRAINNKRLTNLRRKCAISRIKDWNKDPKADKERMESVSDHHDIDDDSPEIYSCYQTEVINRSDLDEVIM